MSLLSASWWSRKSSENEREALEPTENNFDHLSTEPLTFNPFPATPIAPHQNHLRNQLEPNFYRPPQIPAPSFAGFGSQSPYQYQGVAGASYPAASQIWSAEESIQMQNPPTLAMDFGPIHHLMIDRSVEEIWINSPHKVFISRNGKTELTTVFLTGELIENIVERALMWGGRRLDRSHPFVDARLPDGSRLHVAIPDVTAEYWAVNIRKHLMHGKSLLDLSGMGVFSDEVRALLSAAVKGRKNILVSGSTQAGKTTLLNALISEIPPYERVITIEEVFEIRSVLPDVVSLQTRSASLEGTGEITLRHLIKESLRMRPSRLVVGEIREAESLDLLIALNSGIPGMATIHGNSARDAIRKLQTLPLLAGENISHQFIAPTVARSIDWVVHLGLDPETGKRELREIFEVTGRVESGNLEMEEIFILKRGSDEE
jgi:pilus assembly protein CpaF